MTTQDFQRFGCKLRGALHALIPGAVLTWSLDLYGGEIRSHGWRSHSGATLCVSLVIIHTIFSTQKMRSGGCMTRADRG